MPPVTSGYGPVGASSASLTCIIKFGSMAVPPVISVRHHFIKHHVANGDVALEYLRTDDQPADLLTKSLDRIKVSKFRQILLGRE